MLNKRLAAILPIKNNIVVQSIGFNRYLPIGKPEIAVEFLNNWGIDEIIILDIDATPEKRRPNFEMLKKISKKNFSPLAVGGGIFQLSDIKKFVRWGVEKVVINTAAINNPGFIKKAAEIFGRQCIVVGVDVKRISGKYKVFSNCGKKQTNLVLIEWLKKVENLGAGEIFINSIDKDGMKNGYDYDLIKLASKNVNLPVIASGGAGQAEHFRKAFDSGASAAAAGNFFNFMEHSPIIVKSYIREKGEAIRIETPGEYINFNFLANGRISKMTDNYLDKIRFEYIPKEII